MRHRSINRNSAVASGSSFFNGWRSTPGTTPLTSQLVLLISTTTTKVEIGSNAARLRLRSLTCGTGQPPSVRMDDEGATTSAAPPHSFSHLGCMTAKTFRMRSSACDTPNLWRKVAERGAAPRAAAARSSARADGKRRVSLRKLVRTRFLPPDEGINLAPQRWAVYDRIVARNEGWPEFPGRPRTGADPRYSAEPERAGTRPPGGDAE